MVINWLHFLFNLIIAGFVLRYLQMKLAARNPQDPMAKAIAFVY